MDALIVGADSAIGKALIDRLRNEGTFQRVFTTSRRSGDSGSESCQLDICAQADFKRLEEFLAENHAELGLVINTVGILHTPENGPEKSVTQVESDFFLQNMQVNALASLMLAGAVKDRLSKSSDSVFAAVSAKVGSIEDNRLGGWYSYRCSKAALNMALKTLSREWRRSHPKCCIAALHPGTTDSPLSQPFQANVPAQKLFSPAQTADYLLSIIARLAPEDSGKFWAWDGAELPW